MNAEHPVFRRPALVVDAANHYCPGCSHGVAHRLAAEVLEELELGPTTVLVSSIGCSVFLYNYLDVDSVEAPHGRAPAVATGLKRARPECFVLTYQGDGDLASIGLAEILHAANRGERISVVFVNNTVYGMTGGQMAPTTLPGQKTTTCPSGRCPADGGPLRMAEMLAALPGTAFSARAALHTPSHVQAARQAVRQAFLAQTQDRGLGFVELLATCPVNWRMTPLEAKTHVDAALIPAFPLGTFKDAEAQTCAAR